MLTPDERDQLLMVKREAKAVRRRATLVVQMVAQLLESATESDTSEEDTNNARNRTQPDPD